MNNHSSYPINTPNRPLIAEGAPSHELDIQITTAKQFPRSISKSLEEALTLATSDKDTAESCFYALVRADKNGQRKDIMGPSIRLAEIFAYSWGNFHAATRIIEHTSAAVVAEGVAWDLEKNTRISKQIKRSILTAKGYTYSQDMQLVTANAAMSLALRNAIFSVIPKAFILQIYEKCKLVAVGNEKDRKTRIEEIIQSLEEYGIDPEKIYRFFGKKEVNLFTRHDVEILIGQRTMLKENQLTAEQAFTVLKEKETVSPVHKLKEILNNPEASTDDK